MEPSRQLFIRSLLVLSALTGVLVSGARGLPRSPGPPKPSSSPAESPLDRAPAPRAQPSPLQAGTTPTSRAGTSPPTPHPPHSPWPPRPPRPPSPSPPPSLLPRTQPTSPPPRIRPPGPPGPPRPPRSPGPPLPPPVKSPPSPPPTPPSPPLVAPPSFTSLLWGQSGELWRPDSRLPDWSFAGYAAGEKPLPPLLDPPTTNTFVGSWRNGIHVISVKGYGAVGNGTADDTAAIQKACDQAPVGSTLYFPPGRYKITKRVVCSNGISWQGAGKGITTLYFPIPLSQVDHKNVTKGSYSFSDYFVTLQAGAQRRPSWSTNFTADAARGSFIVQVANMSLISPGIWVAMTVSDDNKGSLFRDLNGHTPGDIPCTTDKCFNTKDLFSFHSRVLEVLPGSKGGGTLLLERPLPWNIQAAFKPRIFAWQPTTTDSEVGISGFTFFFPYTVYPGHYWESGYNALHLRGFSNCWIRDVELVNADQGMQLSSARFCTITDVLVRTEISRGNIEGHHSISLVYDTVDSMVTNFVIKSVQQHDITFDWFCRGGVIKDGQATDMSMDIHHGYQHSVLFTNVSTGRGNREWIAGGTADRGPHASSFMTLWNVYCCGTEGAAGRSAPIEPPPIDWGPLMNLVGSTLAPYVRPGAPWLAASWWIETGQHPPFVAERDMVWPKVHAVVDPPNLHTAMAATRTWRLARWRPSLA